MASGSQVWNEKGVLVVDTTDSSLNLSFIKKSNSAVSTDRLTYTASSKTALIAVAASSGKYVKVEINPNIGYDDIRSYVITIFDSNGGITTDNVVIYEFDTLSSPNVQNQGFGVQAFNADGKICYSSACPTIRIISSIFGASTAFYSKNPSAITYTSDFSSSIQPAKTAIMFFSSSTACFAGGNTRDPIYLVEACAITDIPSKKLIMKYLPRVVGGQGEGRSSVAYGYCSGMCMAIDVTGL